MYTEQKKYPDAIRELETAVNLSGRVTVYQCALARAYALSGNSGEARKTLRDVETMQGEARGSGTALAAVYLALGNSEKALYWVEHTAPGDLQANWLRVDPEFDALRANPRFTEVLRRLGARKQE